MKSLVLASTSPYRRELLGRLGLAFDTVDPAVEEEREPGEGPQALATRLARKKAAAAAAMRPGDVIIAADQVVALGETVLGKPGTKSAARDQLRLLAGRSHRLITAVCVGSDGDFFESSVVHDMQMRSLSDAEIAAYVEEESPVDCAGAYRIEAGGIRLFRALSGADYTGIVGLPLTTVWSLLEACHYITPAEPETSR